MKTMRIRPKILIMLGAISMFFMLALVKLNAGTGSKIPASQMKPQKFEHEERNLNHPYDFEEQPNDPHVVRQQALNHKGRDETFNEIAEINARRQQGADRPLDFRPLNDRFHNAGKEPLKFVNNGDYPILRNNMFIPEARIVHLDLKGAQPKIDYMIDLLKLIKKLGGTGVLIEWEDTFPYDGELEMLRSGTAYSKDQIRKILQRCVDEKLDIIPLVQTFGHLEFILKYEKYAKYRQEAKYPQVICLADEDAVQLVETILDQVLALHKEFPMPYFHMGADEAFQVGRCEKDIQYMKENQYTPEKLMLRHIARIGDFIAKKINGTRVLMWHDMLNNVDRSTIKAFELGKHIEPVVWNYAENLDNQFYPDFWSGFGRNFDYIWAASSYKGADGPDRYWSNVPHYLENHKSWLQHMSYAYKDFKRFRGIILTGWQRFDHFALLAEILPVGVPSMAVNLQVLQAGLYNGEIGHNTATLLDCSGGFNYGLEVSQCRFPGFAVYEAIQRLKGTLECVADLEEDYQYRGWLSHFNRQHNYSQAWYLDNLLNKIEPCNSMIDSIASTIRTEMQKIFFDDTVDEFILEYVEPHTSKLQSVLEDAKRLGEIRRFPQRPFKIELDSAIEQKRRDADRKVLSKDQNEKILEQGADKKHLSVH